MLMGWRLTVVSQWEVLAITGRNLHSVISDHQMWQLDTVVACWGFCLCTKQVVLENGCQSSPWALCLQRKLQVIKSAFKCLRGNDSKDVTMGYIDCYLISLMQGCVCSKSVRAPGASMGPFWNGSDASPPALSLCFCLIVLRHGRHPPSRARTAVMLSNSSLVSLGWNGKKKKKKTLDSEIYCCKIKKRRSKDKPGGLLWS